MASIAPVTEVFLGCSAAVTGKLTCGGKGRVDGSLCLVDPREAELVNRTDPPAATDFQSGDERDSRLDAIVTAYLESRERGEHPVADEWISRYPALAPDLADFLDSFDEVDKAFAPLRALAMSPPTVTPW
jgi:hypothetical protein